MNIPSLVAKLAWAVLTLVILWYASGYGLTGAVAYGWLMLAGVYAGYVAVTGYYNPLVLTQGTDGRYSVSKLQFLMWTIAVVWAASGLIGAFGDLFVGADGVQWDLPSTLLLAMGFSSATLIAAKGITTHQVATGQLTKTAGAPDVKQLVNDDSDTPDLLKMQMFVWTVVAIAAFLKEFNTDTLAACRTLAATGKGSCNLPEISPTFLVLMGLAQGTYLGKKMIASSDDDSDAGGKP